MMANTAGKVSDRPRYYRSFVSYEIPFRPDGELEFPRTEGLRSFYAAYFDDLGHLVRFDKVRLVRDHKDPRPVPLAEPLPPGSAVYFEAADAAGEVRPGRRISYDATEGLSRFFAGKVDASGRTGQVVPLRKEVAFRDEYDYWPNGKVRTRTMSGADAPDPSVAHFNERGRPLAAPPPPTAAGPEKVVLLSPDCGELLDADELLDFLGPRVRAAGLRRVFLGEAAASSLADASDQLSLYLVGSAGGTPTPEALAGLTVPLFEWLRGRGVRTVRVGRASFVTEEGEAEEAARRLAVALGGPGHTSDE